MREMKDSGIKWIGVIPLAWRTARVKNVAETMQSGGTPDSSNDILLLYTYKECVDNLRIVLNPMWTKNYIAPKVDFNRPINKNSVVSNIQGLPFSSKSEIFELATGGYVEKEVLTRYLHIQAEYTMIS